MDVVGETGKEHLVVSTEAKPTTEAAQETSTENAAQ